MSTYQKDVFKPSHVESPRVFEAWSGMRSAIALRTLSTESVESYRFIWNSWCEFLVNQKMTWDQAASLDVRHFLEALASSRGSASRASPVTQKRYFRILKEIYACAVASGWLALNPVDHDALVSSSERHDSLVFNRVDWAEIYKRLPVASDAAPEGALPWQHYRDHAILLMFMQAALTVSEVRQLPLASIEHPRLVWTGPTRAQVDLPFPPWDAQATAPMLLHVGGQRAAQSRTLVLPAPCSLALWAWLELRLAMPLSDGTQSPVFISQKGLKPLSAKSLFTLASSHILRSLSDRYGSDHLAHAGPMTLRNSCIVRWMDAGLPDSEVLTRSGLAEAQALRRLRHHVHRASDLVPKG